MNWRVKWLGFLVFEHVPHASLLHRFSQRYITKRYLKPARLETYGIHTAAFLKHCSGGVALEFGAGRNLLAPLLLSHAGARRIYAVDLQRIATIEQVSDGIDRCRAALGGDWPTVASFDELEQSYRIIYRAPCDARNLDLPDDSVDFVYSTSTLEHIPSQAIKEILAECRRVVRPKGIFSFIIDYHDHYGTADAGISMFNFYRYSSAQWRKYNPVVHYQNRLRHSDYEALFHGSGLETLSADPITARWSAKAMAVKLHKEFTNYSPADLATTNGIFVLSNP